MSTQITTAFVKQFTDGITLLAQQKMTRLRGSVRSETSITGDRAFFDQLGSVTAQAKTGRHGDTPLTDTPHSRRMVTLTPYEHADLIDDSDKIRIMNDPTNDYTRVFAAAFGRAIDDVIIASAFASASTGVDGGTSTAAATGDFQIASGSVGLTLAKLVEANKVLRENENDPEEGFFLAVSQEQIEDILNDSTITSADYNSVRLLMRGEITEFMGFTWINTERLELATDRRCIAWARNSLLLGIGKEPNGRISERDDKSYATQVFYSMDIGATRMDETGVVEILCTE